MGYWGAGNAELSAGDLNGDGRADLVLAAQDGINSIAYTYHDGTIGVAEIYRPSAITEYQPTPIENGTPFNGVIAGRLSVSPTGAAIYSLPIELPPGIGGMQPTLSLEYNSQSGNGHLGMGWSLSGLSAIARCGATLAQDGFIDPVDFDGNDRLCLDGKRLVQVANTGCSGGVEYRTEIDSYARICAYGAQGSGPAWFKVWTKAGLTMEYGGTANARIEAQGRSDVLLWAMSKASDTVGNYLNVSYHEDNTNGEFYPTRIDYTGNSNQGLAPYNSVRFSYEQRPDQSSGWVGGSRSGSSVRMTNVQAYTGNSLVRDTAVP